MLPLSAGRAQVDCRGMRRGLETMLKERFAVEHTTLQVGHVQPQFVPITRS